MLIRKPLFRASTFFVSEREMNFVPLKTIRAKARMGEEALERVHSWTRLRASAGFERTRGDRIGLAGRRLDHSHKVSMSCYKIREL